MYIKTNLKKNKFGFTLVELLVVISIIALLLSILMPSLQKARESAKKVVCLSNLKSCSLVWGLYAADNKDVIVPANYLRDEVKRPAWFDRLARYVPSSNDLIYRAKWPEKPDRTIFMCPSLKATYVDSWGIAYATSYGLNVYSGSVLWAGRTLHRNYDNGVRVTEIRSPSEKVIFSDGYVNKKWHSYETVMVYSDPVGYWEKLGMNYMVGMNHQSEGASFMWADGHASFESKNKWDLANPEDRTGVGWWVLTGK